MANQSRCASGESRVSQRSLPSQNDPVIASVLQTSIAQSRASSLHNFPITLPDKEQQDHPFRRWLSTLRQRSLKGKNAVCPRRLRQRSNEDEDDPPSPSASILLSGPRLKHRKSSSWNSGSTALLAGTRTAFASMSILSNHRQSASDGAFSLAAKSRKSNRGSLSIEIDREALHERAMKRRQVIDELVQTESDYIVSLKALDNLYRSVCITATEPLKNDMNKMQVILDRLADLHHGLAHTLQSARGVSRFLAEPKEAAEIARIFGQHLSRFFLYEEYGAKYEEMLHNVGLASQNIPDWENYQRGFETLSNLIVPQEQGSLGRKKSLTFGDLHIKPIQRVCKYPLIFADLCKCTPVIDGPEEHLELEKILFRLRDTVMEINQATVDNGTRERMLRSWKLQDMLIFSNTLLAPHILRSLGHARLCGALYIAYQSSKGIVGEYMLCALFKSYMVLATPVKRDGVRKYQVVASIALGNIKLHSADSEFGLQCFTAPCAWKILFDVDSTICEILVVAASISERETWMQAILENADGENAVSEQFSTITLNTTSIASVIGKPGSLLRSMAMKEIQTTKRQIIIRNSLAMSSGDIHVTMRERIAHPVLNPRRSDLLRIEDDIETSGCRENTKSTASQKSRILRASASTLLRKLSRSSKNSVLAY